MVGITKKKCWVFVPFLSAHKTIASHAVTFKCSMSWVTLYHDGTGICRRNCTVFVALKAEAKELVQDLENWCNQWSKLEPQLCYEPVKLEKNVKCIKTLVLGLNVSVFHLNRWLWFASSDLVFTVNLYHIGPLAAGAQSEKVTRQVSILKTSLFYMNIHMCI